MPETLSAFANGAGGWVLLGLDEQAGFRPAAGFKASASRDALAGACADRLQPPLRPAIEIVEVEGGQVVAAWIEPLRPVDRPCYVKERGRYQGSFIRTGDVDRRLSVYEVDRLVEEHRQPRHDEEVVAEAALEDLDQELVAALVARQRRLRPRVFGQGEPDVILQRLRAALPDDAGRLRPTLAGLLALGRYPQEFFPRLTVTFAAYPGVTKAPPVGELRLLDSVTLAGPVPALIQDAVAAVRRNARNGARMEAVFRVDVPDYPPLAVREAVTNGLMHRDLSELARGTQVQVNLFLDRLEVLSPGGLYGTVTVDRLGDPGISSTRNLRLSALLEDTPYPDGGMVAENRGSGYALIQAELKEAGLRPPVPADNLASFAVTMYRRDAPAETPPARGTTVRHLLRDGVDRSTPELVAATGLSRSAVTQQLNALIREGAVEATAPPRSPRRRYRWLAASRAPETP
jgi:ATP-dependent DNA helicase RecG